MPIEWKKYGDEKPEKDSEVVVFTASGNTLSAWYRKWYGEEYKWIQQDTFINIYNSDLWLYSSQLAATAEPGAKLYTEEEIIQNRKQSINQNLTYIQAQIDERTNKLKNPSQ